MAIDEAREFIEAAVVRPGLASDAVSQRAKRSIESARHLFGQFRKVGDLIRYMERFRGDPGTEVYRSLRSAGLRTFEDIREEFLRRFGARRDDRTRLDDFKVGETYGAYDLLIFADVYDPRSGGILPIGRFGDHRAVFIRATLSGGRYANAWIDPGDRLKYYLFSIQGRFDEGFQANRSIIDHPDVLIYAFVRDTGRDRFRLAGLFRSAGVHEEEDGTKWFDLVRLDAPAAAAAFSERALAADLAGRVARSASLRREERRKRLGEARRLPPVVVVSTTAYLRNPDVIAEVLERAGGVCECCGRPAPFARNRDGSPYLEVHHKVPLAAGGLALRLGLRLTAGLVEADGRALVKARRAGNGAPFACVEEVARRAGFGRPGLEALAAADAFAGMAAPWRAALWAATGFEGTGDLPLFGAADAGASGGDGPLLPEPAADLPAQRIGEEVVEDYTATDLTLRPHPMALLRPALDARGLHDTRRLGTARSGSWIKLPGLVLMRQRPGTAKGVVFVTVEDEYGSANLVVYADVGERDRRALVGARLLVAEGRVERETERAEVPITHLICRRLIDRSDLLDGMSAIDGGGGAAWAGRALGRADEVRRPDPGSGKPHPDGAAPRLPRSRDFR